MGAELDNHLGYEKHDSAGWGSGNSEKNMFSWFAGRPLAQAKAAVLTSLLPWPDDAQEQRREPVVVPGR